MKWFKHEVRARSDERIAHLEHLAGLEGYGFYFKLLEVVAELMDGTGKCSATYSLTKWAHLLYIHHNKFSKLLGKCEVAGLVTVKYHEGNPPSKAGVSIGVMIEVIIPNLLKYRDNHTKNLQATSKQELELDKELELDLDKELSESVEGSQIPEDENSKKTHTQIQTGLISDGLKSIGMMPINPTLPKFIALLEAGATVDEFVNAAIERRGTDKFNFSYLLTTMVNRRQDVANQNKLHKGAMPASTSREAGRNIAAKSIFTPENTKHLQGNNLNLIGVENEVRAITNSMGN